MLESDLRPVHLHVAGLTPELFEYLGDLGSAGRPDGMVLRQQAARRVDGLVAVEMGVTVVEELAARSLVIEPPGPRR